MSAPLAPLVTAIAWTTNDDKYLLNLHFLVVGRYFVMGSTYEDDGNPTTWLTRMFDDEAAARAYALLCTQNVEMGGDELVSGPAAYEIPDPSAALSEILHDDEAFDWVDEMFTTVVMFGTTS